MSGYLNRYNLQGWLYKDARLVGEEPKKQYILNMMETKTCRRKKNEGDEAFEIRKSRIIPRFITIYLPAYMEWVSSYKKNDMILADVRVNDEKVLSDPEKGTCINKICTCSEIINITKNADYIENRRNTNVSRTMGDTPQEVSTHSFQEDIPF